MRNSFTIVNIFPPLDPLAKFDALDNLTVYSLICLFHNNLTILSFFPLCTTGEMLMSLAGIFFMDDISNGLDSSTTHEIIKYLSQMAHLMDTTLVISLLQPSPETFELFDDIILLCEGKIVYQGPRENVLEFFERMGFKCPERKNLADFLQEVLILFLR